MTDDFLNSLWPSGVPEGGAIQMWRLNDKKTFSFSNVPAAATWAKGYQTEDIYIAAGLGPGLSKPVKTRTPAGHVLGIPGVWADLDVNGGPEGKTGAAPTTEAATALAHSVAEPTIIINSGYGIQAWWLFEEPWLFIGDTADNERTRAAQLVQSFQAALRANARADDYNIDSTHDLARLMRLPGTVNCKGAKPAPVAVIVGDGPRYAIEHLSELTRDHGGSIDLAFQHFRGENVDVIINDHPEPPFARITELRDISPAFNVAWEYGRTGRPGRPSEKSASEWDMSIANHLVNAGFSEQEVCDSLVWNRKRHGDPHNKANRLDYIKTTVGKAMASSYMEVEQRRIVEERDEAIESISMAAVSGVADPVRTTSLFSKILGGPEIKRLIQDGIDPSHAQFRLELDDGREVPIGNADNLLDPRKFRAAFMVITRHVIPNIKGEKWHDVIQALMMAADVNEEDSRNAIVHGWLDGYLDGTMSTDRDAACQVHDPFVHDGEVFVAVGGFGDWLRRVKGLRLKDSELYQYLQAGGFERKAITYTKDTGKRSQRSYWVCPKEALPFL